MIKQMLRMKIKRSLRQEGVVLGMTGLALAAILLGACPAVTKAAATAVNAQPAAALVKTQPAAELSANWTGDARQTLQVFLRLYGKGSGSYASNNKPYAVFDFDNTTSILDV